MVRLLLIGVVTLIVGGAVVGYVLFNQSRPDVAAAAGNRPLADFLVREHQAAKQAGASGQWEVTTAEEFRSRTGVWLGRQMEWDESICGPESEFRLIGARVAEVPGPGRSVQVLLATEDGASASVFLQQYLATPELERKVGHTLAVSGGGLPIIVCVPGGQTHYLVADDAATMTALRTSLDIPEPTKDYPR